MLVPFLAAAVGVGTPALQAWAVDPLVKVFKDDLPASAPIDPMAVARGEVAEWQIVVRSPEPLTGLKVTVGSLRGKDGDTIGRPRIRAIGYVTVDETVPVPAHDILRKAPCDYPDPLLTAWPDALAANLNQPFWIDLSVPKSARAGIYRAPVTIQAGGSTQTVPISIDVRDVTVGNSRLWVTNWFTTGSGHMPGSNQPGTKAEQEYLRTIAEKMAAHRQNVAIISPLNLAKYSWDSSGRLQADFSRFDQWVGIFRKAGVIGRIEGGHIGGRTGEPWESPFGVNVATPQGMKMVAADSPEAEMFYSQFLPQLVDHLKKKRWWGIYIQHLGDEPYSGNWESYLKMAALVHKYAPDMKVIEATHSTKLAGAVQIWVPQLDIARANYDFFARRQKAGDEFWMYTCVYPQGEYANRFVELPLLKTRLLHWINYRYGITGYLHWGFDYWVKGDPFDDMTRTKAKDGWGGFLPAGDSWIVYPKDGQLLDSIRYEAMRDGIADYELLSMLAKTNPDAARRLAERLVLAFDRYDTDVAHFRAVRRELLERLARA